MSLQPTIAAQRIVVIMPNWLGDAVMATPFLRALRTLYPEAHIAALHIPLVVSVVADLPFINEIHEYTKAESSAATRYLRQGRFDLAVLLPNSFRSAWMAYRAGIPRRLGYAREWRSPLLTDRVRPILRTADQRGKDGQIRQAIRSNAGRTGAIGSPYQPIPTIDYYLKLTEYLGAPPEVVTNRRLELGLGSAEIPEANAILAAQGVGDQEPLVVLVPGANFGSSKCWLPERFARLADHIMDAQGDFRATVLIASSPAEKPIVDAILAASYLAPKGRLVALANLNNGHGISLGVLKALVQRATLMVCNDTGPRHFAVAFGIPVVTLFGPTDPIWAETFYDRERRVSVPVPCGPCQLKKCPIDHRCMTAITVEQVRDAIRELWPAG